MLIVLETLKVRMLANSKVRAAYKLAAREFDRGAVAGRSRKAHAHNAVGGGARRERQALAEPAHARPLRQGRRHASGH
jgi:hypothetical protein